MSKKISHVDRKLSAERTHPVAMSKGRALLDEYMIGSMYDAEKEIAKAHSKRVGAMGYAVSKGERVDGDTPLEEFSEHDHMLMDVLAEFKKNIPTWAYGISLDIAALCFDVEDVAYQRSMRSADTVCKIYTDALNEWCILRGMGDQKG